MRASALVAACAWPRYAQAPIVEFDHLWIAVSPGAPERIALEQAGFTVWPAVQRHDGQGTASVMVELDRCFIELIWPDSSVRVAPETRVGAEKFAKKSRWRTSGWSPFGIGLRRRPGAPDSLPFTTWPLSAPWQQSGDVTRMITARTDTISPSVWVVGRSSAVDNSAAPAESRLHRNGARRITALQLTVPANTPDSEPLRVLQANAVATIVRGDKWLLTVTLDSARQRRLQDLRPALPLIVRY